ncbi:FixH protein [Saccharicrinis carchari]|uniref:FixH protein n=1 Tax=Saccharicrinis carchari TaxID=1168039 RepID=A0A521CKN5_SACCC|nr:FixH family protein [Saccharicrinis carchari]SMO59996.1 FixH protein [Saccharicrinis carchari]
MKLNWGHGILVFFVIFFTWIISFVVFSLGENNDLVTKDYYRQGAEYSLKMETDKRSAVYKDSISIQNENTGVKVLFAASLATDGVEKQIYFYRASDKKHDVTLLVPSGQDGIFIDGDRLVKGRYNVSVSWGKDEGKYMVSKDFVVR